MSIRKICSLLILLALLLSGCTVLQPAVPTVVETAVEPTIEASAQPKPAETSIAPAATVTENQPAETTAPVQTEPSKTETAVPEIANPASANCVAQGGTVSIQERGDGGQYGVCLFEDNRQCEEWALMHGDCPVGGLKVTGYITPAAQYCVITGGSYTITGESNTDIEQGTCTLKSGGICDVWDYFNGECDQNQAQNPTPEAGPGIQPLVSEVCNGQAQAMAHALDVTEVTQSESPLSDPATGANGVGCQAAASGTGEKFTSPEAAVEALGSMLITQGWVEDPQFAAGGPTGLAAGFRKDNQVCVAAAGWRPDQSVNCPTDQPISACKVSPEQQLYTVSLTCGQENPAGQQTAEPPSGMLVFNSTRGGGGIRDLFTMNGLGYDLSRLTRGEADSLAGPWSAISNRILFTSFGLTNSSISAINPDGSDPVSLSEVRNSDEAFPAWSPDGRRIAFTSRRDGNNEIYVMNADGSDPRRLTNAPGDDFAPSWSPNGLQIVFVSDRDQSPGIYDLYVMNADGSELRRLTDDPAIDYSPDWSPDNSQIIYRSHSDGPGEIYVINLDGSGKKNLTNNRAEDWAPSWSPDGSLIAFQTYRDGNWEIYVMAADGSGLVNLTNDPAEDQLPHWKR